MDDILSLTLFGKTRRAVLGLLFGQPSQAFFLRQITRTLDVGHGAVQRELGVLAESGILTQRREGNQLYFQANPQCPLFQEIKAIVQKTIGVEGVIRQSLQPLLDHIEVAFLFGSVSQGTESAGSDVDLAVIGRASFRDIVQALQPAQKLLHREINPVVFSTVEFRKKVKLSGHFASSLITTPKTFLIGGIDEFKKLGSKRVVKTP